MRPLQDETHSQLRHFSSPSKSDRPRTFRYVVKHHEGFAPCFEDGICTLACCKPKIRRTARIGDWILGFAPRRWGDARLRYAMRVGEILDFSSYASDSRFTRRKDNIWQPDGHGDFRRVAAHEDHDTADDKARDLSGRYVLVADRHRDFGDGGLDLCAALGEDVALRLWYPGRGHKVNGLDLGDREAFIVAFDRIAEDRSTTSKRSRSSGVKKSKESVIAGRRRRGC